MNNWLLILILILMVMVMVMVMVAIFGSLAKGGQRRKFKYNPSETWPFENKKLMTVPE